MTAMFRGASVFNQDLSNFETSQVMTMAGMFQKATLFNQPLMYWNTSGVKDMSSMFELATLFNLLNNTKSLHVFNFLIFAIDRCSSLSSLV